MTNEELEKALQRAYRCIQGLHTLCKDSDSPVVSYHILSIAAAKRYVFGGTLDSQEYFIGKPASVLQEALQLEARK